MAINQPINNKNPEQKPNKTLGYFMLLELGIEFALILALPLIGAIYLGHWLDGKMHTKFFIIIAILVALFLSWYLIFKKINEARKLIK